MTTIWEQTFLGNTLTVWLTAATFLIIALIAISLFKKFILLSLKKWSSKTNTSIDDFIAANMEQSGVPLLYLASFYFILNTLTISAKVDRILHVCFLFVVTYLVLGIITSIIREFIFSFIKTHTDSETKEKQAKGLIIIVNIVVWILGVVFLIDNLGYNVTTLVTGLGIGGIAIALAAQTILGDLFSYFVIFFDRPFEIGDFIIIGDKMGTVDYIGIKTTRLKALNGEQLICSNTYLTNAQVHNYKRMDQRRIVFKLGVVYQTSYEKIKLIPQMVKDIIQSVQTVRFDRAHFSGFGDSSLDFEFVFNVDSSDYNLYMDRQQEIFLAIFQAFEREKIEFAYPTRTLFLSAASDEESETKQTI